MQENHLHWIGHSSPSFEAMSSSYQQSLAELNNLGVGSLEIGDFSKAFLYFRMALCHGRAELHKLQASVVPQQIESGKPTRLVHSLPLYQECLFADRNAPFYTFDKTNYIHSRGIEIPSTPGAAFSEDALQEGKFRSAAIIFNLGLLFHLKGLAGSFCHQYLYKARTLYQQCYPLIMTDMVCYLDCNATGNAAFDLLSLALLNNMARLSLSLKEYNECNSLFRLLIWYALAIQKKGYKDEHHTTLMDQQIESLFLYLAISGCYCILALAPAA